MIFYCRVRTVVPEREVPGVCVIASIGLHKHGKNRQCNCILFFFREILLRSLLYHPSSAEYFEMDLYRMVPLLTITLTMVALERHMYRFMFLN